MNRRWVRCIGVAASACMLGALAGAGAGCDQRKLSVPPPTTRASNNADAAAPKIPTTQELLTAPRRRTDLSPFPLTLDLPPGWQPMKDATAPNLWQGYSPSGQVQFQVNSRRTVTPAELNRLMAGASREMSERPNEVLEVELRPHGDDKILERQSVGQPAPFTLYDNNNVPHTTTESIFNWSTSLLVPSGGKYRVYELNFIGLTRSQYEKDKDFLASILDTFQYAPSVTQPATAQANASPLARSNATTIP